MVSSKIAVIILSCLALHAKAEGEDSCNKYIKKFADEINHQSIQIQEQIHSMKPVLKDFMWQALELEYKVREMRENLEHFTAVTGLNHSGQESKTASNIFTRQTPSGFGAAISGKLSPPVSDRSSSN